MLGSTLQWLACNPNAPQLLVVTTLSNMSPPVPLPRRERRAEAARRRRARRGAERAT
jgi:hypothetical protein